MEEGKFDGKMEDLSGGRGWEQSREHLASNRTKQVFKTGLSA
jgi:hypothetical protein